MTDKPKPDFLIRVMRELIPLAVDQLVESRLAAKGVSDELRAELERIGNSQAGEA